MPKVATNVRLETGHLKQLKRIALEKDQSLARLFEDIISDYLTRVSALSSRDWKADPFFQLGRRPGHSGRSIVSEQHDRHLYRARRRPS